MGAMAWRKLQQEQSWMRTRPAIFGPVPRVENCPSYFASHLQAGSLLVVGKYILRSVTKPQKCEAIIILDVVQSAWKSVKIRLYPHDAHSWMAGNSVPAAGGAHGSSTLMK